MTRHLLLAASALTAIMGAPAFAEDAPAKWSDTLKLGVQIEAGITGNPSGPKDNLNFGHLFTDRANEPVMNQGLVTLGRPLDPKATGYDFAFKLQGMYGTDARYTHFARLFDKTTKGRYQFDVVEASVSLHAPLLTEGGVDLQAGLWPTPLGFETIDPSTNPFYSHSYIFNFGLPFKHSGANAIVHVNEMLDLYAGVTAGTNVIAGMDNNSSAGFLGGAKLTLLDGTLTVLGLTHIGPEQPTRVVRNASKFNRYYNDVAITYKPNDKLTLVTELNYVQDEFARAEAFGIAQYAAYPITETVTFNARAEAFRDTKGYFVAAFPTAQGAVQSLEGYTPATGPVSYGKTTYGALTLGLTYKPALPDSLGSDTTLLVRPEIRVDSVLAGGNNFNAGRDKSAVTIGADAVLSF